LFCSTLKKLKNGIEHRGSGAVAGSPGIPVLEVENPPPPRFVKNVTGSPGIVHFKGKKVPV